MDIVESTELWKNSFGTQNDDGPVEKEFRERLANAFKRFRNNAAKLADEIRVHLPDHTDHSIEHIDSLWKIASLLIPSPDYLNPTEVFILGGAFLTHDLGLALAAYQDGLTSLESYPEWRKLLAKELWRRNGIFPTKQEVDNADSDAIQATKEHVLILKHAEKARDLVTESFSSTGCSEPYYLLEDQELRGQYGHLIGEIAYSHWWSVEKVVSELSQHLGAHPDGSTAWTVDQLKIALLLRVCDVCHLDSKRAPGLQRALRKPTGVGKLHWRFSEKIQFPHIEHSEVCFTSTSPFSIEDREAWWVGFDLLSLANQELASVDSVLERSDKDRLKANRVAGMGSTLQLAKLIKTSGWIPIDTRIKASNVANLVTRLGGKGLYGERPWVPVRELLQNAHDAVLARRVESDLDDDWGEITVRLTEMEGEFVLEIQDTGIGMSEAVVTGPLLDFGESYWDSALAMQEHPKLSLDRFRPVGKFGIGFFSVFMTSDLVQIITRTSSDAKSNTRVLQFDSGVKSPPLLRAANQNECLEECGTKIKLWLKHKPGDKDWFLNPGDASPFTLVESAVRKEPWKLSELCEWLCPASEVTIKTEEKGIVDTSVSCRDWIEIDGIQLVRRTLLEKQNLEGLLANKIIGQVADCLSILKDDEGNVVARAALIPQFPQTIRKTGPFLAAINLAGPFRSYPTVCLLGLLRGRTVKLDRVEGHAIRLTSEPVLAEWATEQAKKASKVDWNLVDKTQIAGLVRSLAGDTSELPIARTGSNTLLSFHDITKMSLDSEVRLINDHWGVEGSFPNVVREIPKGSLGVAFGKGGSLFDLRFEDDFKQRSNHPIWHQCWLSLWAAVVEAIALSWNASLDDVLAASRFDIGRKTEGSIETGDFRFTEGYDLIIRP